MSRLHQAILIISTILASWLGMQAVHELGHVLGAWATGGKVERVVLNPLKISRTDLASNPSPLVVVWAGPILGSLLPLVVWGAWAAARIPGAYLPRFFAGACLIINGAYIGGGSFQGIGDCGEMFRHGSAIWQLWLFGLATAPAGVWLWHRQGSHFGLGAEKGKVDVRAAYASLAVCIALLTGGFLLG